ncbi:hypothetical protein [Moritella sp. F3]|uniref:hypothetical protein n=1 Tax=Moritella sp. F3 TaxID=2718882 RepID=UPI0018E100D3|nr:hypothetical protein [Moritella sp. F3]GIC77144.1 hypothetical protein FMO001_18710 [Moritella sp. F1]GIC82263.1 hypothetical protein FMO003_25440 [Moritella sp. F3]
MFGIVILVLFMGTIKVIITAGIDATVNAYITMLQDIKLVEIVLWFMVSFSLKTLSENNTRYKTTFRASSNTQREVVGDGEISETEIYHFSSTPDYDSAKRAFIISKVSFFSSCICLFIFYIFNGQL